MPYLNLHGQSAPINLGRLDVNYNDRTRRVRGNHLAQKIREHFIHKFLPAFSMRLAGSVDLYPRGVAP